MNPLLQLYPGDAAAFLLTTVLLQVTLIVVVAWLLARAGSRWNAAWRYSIYSVALLCVLASPLLAWTMQTAGIALWTLQSPTPATPIVTPAESVASPISAVTFPVAEPPFTPPQFAARTTPQRLSILEPVSTSAVRWAIFWADALRAAGTAALAVWLSVTVWLLVRWGHGLHVVRRLRREAKPLDTETLEGLLADVRQALGVHELPSLATSANLDRPVMVGLLHPLVIVPAAVLRTLPGPRLADVLIHECAHAVCRHQAIGLLQRLAEMAFWPHPLVHLLNWELTRAREEVCDNYVLRQNAAPRYARTLLELSQLLADVAPKPAMLGLFHCHWRLEDRVADLLDQRRKHMIRVSRSLTAAVATAFLLLGLFVAGVKVTQATSAEPPVTQQYAVQKQVKEFPDQPDLATPASAQAAFYRHLMRKDVKAINGMTWQPFDAEISADIEQSLRSDPQMPADWSQLVQNIEILEVLTYRDDLAAVISKGCKFLNGEEDYNSSLFGKSHGTWKILKPVLTEENGDFDSVQKARDQFEKTKENSWNQFVALRNQEAAGQAQAKTSAAVDAAQPATATPPPEEEAFYHSAHSLRNIMSALHTYHNTAGHFPAAYCGWGYDQSQKKWYRDRPNLSWRVALLPLLGEQELFEKFNLGERWDSPQNRALLAQMPKIYRAPGSKADEGKTNYLGIVGPHAAFPDKGALMVPDFTDGTSCTMMLVEVPDATAVEWTRPQDFPADTKNPLPKLIGLRQGGFVCAFADGCPYFVTDAIEPTNLAAFLTRDGGEVVNNNEPADLPHKPLPQWVHSK